MQFRVLSGAPQEMFWVFMVAAALMQPLLVVKTWELIRRLGGFRGVEEGARAVLWRLWSGRIEGAETHTALGSVLASRRVTIARTVINGWWGVMAMMGLKKLIFAATKPSIVASDLFWLAALLSTTVGVAFPQIVVERTLAIWLWYGTLIYCGLTLGVPFMGVNVTFFLWWWPFSVVYSIALGALFLKFRSLLLTNICIFICQIISFITYDPACMAFEINILSLIYQELLLLVCKLLVLYCVELAVIHSAKKEIEAALGKCQLSAVFSMLGLVCDAVVDLDSDFVFKEDSTKLAGLLMHRPGKSLHGLPFAQFVAPDVDQQPRQGLSEECDQLGDIFGGLMDSHPKMVSLRMRDAMGTAFPATLYHMPYHNIDGRLNHLIGLQEASDDRDGAVAPGVHSQRPFPAATLNAGIAEALVVGRSLLDGDIADLGGVSSRSSGSSGSGSGDVELGAILVKAEKDLPIFMADEEVLSRLGLPKEGGSFLEAFPNGGRKFCKGILKEFDKPRPGGMNVTVHCGDWYLGVQREDVDRKPTWCRLIAETRTFEGIDVPLIKIGIKELGPRGGRVMWRNRPGPLLTGSLTTGSAGHSERMVRL